jgi:hypothetical protein
MVWQVEYVTVPFSCVHCITSCGFYNNQPTTFNRSAKYYVNQNIESAQQYLNSLGIGGDNEGDEVAGNEVKENGLKEMSAETKAEAENILASAPMRGASEGRFAIIEYTELLCPFCQRHSQQGTLNAVMEQFP